MASTKKYETTLLILCPSQHFVNEMKPLVNWVCALSQFIVLLVTANLFTMVLLKFILFAALIFTTICDAAGQSKGSSSTEKDTGKIGKLVTEVLTSTILKENRIGLNLNRNIKIYLPPDYATSSKSYPVVYFCHNIFWNNEKMFEDGRIVKLIDSAFASGLIKEFIFVVPDYSTSTTGSIYENSIVSGKWLDHTVNEIVPFIDKKFRTIPQRESRAVIGEFMGGRGALKLAMTHADIFSVVYALHPVATGNGDLPWRGIGIDWEKLHNAKAYPIPGLDGRTQIFLTVSQAFLPNLNRPPLFCDFFMERENSVPKLHRENTLKSKNGFLLDETLLESADNLRHMRGIGFDWGRFDPTQAHVVSNREFSRKLEDLGILHEAEEYRGGPYDRTWEKDGRFYTRALPFIARYMIFETTNP